MSVMSLKVFHKSFIYHQDIKYLKISKFYLHEHIMILLAGRYEVRRQGIRNVVTLSFDPGQKIYFNNIFLLKIS